MGFFSALGSLIEQIDTFIPRFQAYELPGDVRQSREIMMEGLRVLRSDAEDLLRKFTVLHDRMERKRKMDAIAGRVQSTMNTRNQVVRLLSETDEVIEELNQKALLLDGNDAVPESLDSELADLMQRLNPRHQQLTVLSEQIRELGGSEIVFVDPSSAIIPYVEPAADVAAVESRALCWGEGC